MIDISKAIPHRDPFLFVDEILEMEGDTISAVKRLDPEMDVFRGHYPDYPIMPGALTCEAIFQAAAILLSWRGGDSQGGVPVMTRIRDAKFKKMVKPGDELILEAVLEDRIGPAFYMKGCAKVNDEIAASVSFTCALTAKK